MTLKQIQEALAAHHDGMAKAWSYEVSHQWLTVRLTAPQLCGNFHLRCGDCERVEFDTCWSPTAVQIEQVVGGFLVHNGAHLRVECGGIEGDYNVQPYLGVAEG
jgi:hypothetical protein